MTSLPFSDFSRMTQPPTGELMPRRQAPGVSIGQPMGNVPPGGGWGSMIPERIGMLQLGANLARGTTPPPERQERGGRRMRRPPAADMGMATGVPAGGPVNVASNLRSMGTAQPSPGFGAAIRRGGFLGRGVY